MEDKKRSGTQTRRMTKKISITPEAHELMINLSKKWKMRMGDIVEHMLTTFSENEIRPDRFNELLARSYGEVVNTNLNDFKRQVTVIFNSVEKDDITELGEFILQVASKRILREMM